MEPENGGLEWKKEDMESFFDDILKSNPYIQALKNFNPTGIMGGFTNQVPEFDDDKAKSRPITVDDLKTVADKFVGQPNTHQTQNNLYNALMNEIQKAGLNEKPIGEQLKEALASGSPLPEGDDAIGSFKWEHKMLAIKKGSNMKDGLVDIFEVKEAKYTIKQSEFTVYEDRKTLIFQSIRDKDRMFILALHKKDFQPLWFQYGDRVVCTDANEDDSVYTFSKLDWTKGMQDKFIVQITGEEETDNDGTKSCQIKVITLTQFLRAYRFEDEEDI